MEFKPNYRNIQDVAYNKKPERIPLYEHYISTQIMEEIIGEKFAYLQEGNYQEKLEFYKKYCFFFIKMGYDAVSFECCLGSVMPGAGALGGHIEPAIKDRKDFEQYPWEQLEELYFKRFGEDFQALGEVMPEGMKAIGGVGNGVFECVQELVGYTHLCLLKYDDPELYSALFDQVGTVLIRIWERFLKEYGSIYCVCRFGDDLGYLSSTLLSGQDIKSYIIPVYKKIIQSVHTYQKPFLLHSCGKIFSVMDELIEAGIDAKHSNEDSIEKFEGWVKKYGGRIGNFGGIDMDFLCRKSEEEVEDEVVNILNACKDSGGIAFSTGNSIPDYINVENYKTMVATVRRYRGDF